MAASISPNHLDKVGRNLVRWGAELRLTWSLAAIVLFVCVLGLIDLFVTMKQTDRLITWGLLMALAAAALWLVSRALKKRYTDDGVAASIEHAFPELDNRLINYLQFSRDVGNDPFKRAYVSLGAPRCDHLDIRRMKDREAHRRSRMFLGIAAAVLVLPALFAGEAWGVALWRTINPFTSTPPLSLTKIVEIQPGNATVLQGEPLELACRVEGFTGHEVRIDVEPGDSSATTYLLGEIAASADQKFTHRLSKVNTALRYRFRAGDCPASEWFTIETRPPPAFTDILVSVAPPEYTGRPSGTANARIGQLVIPEGSRITVTASANTPLKSNRLAIGEEGEPVAFSAAEDGDRTRWSASATVKEGSALRLAAVDAYGIEFDEEIGFTLDADDPPSIEIVAPVGRTTLPPGESPRIEFRVSDDYGLTDVRLEEVVSAGAAGVSVTPLKQWQVSGTRELDADWASSGAPEHGRDLTYRLVAVDDRAGIPSEIISPLIVFSAPGHAEALKQRRELEEKAAQTLSRVIDLQKQNIGQTKKLQSAGDEATGKHWTETSDRQKEIREITRELLANPAKPLGSLTATVKEVYGNEMLQVIDTLKSIPNAAADQKPALASDALTTEEKILRQLNYAQQSMSQVKQDQRLAGLSAMLKALIRDQKKAHEQTRGFLEKKVEVNEMLVDAQDRLAEDLTDFVNSCAGEAEAVRANDAAFAETLSTIASQTREMKIREDMVIAAERLDEDRPADAIPPQQQALANLERLQGMFDSVKLEQETVKQETMLDAVGQAKENLVKIAEMHKEMLDAMEEIKGASDKNDEELDMMEEAYEEMFYNTKEALLEIPTDLHIFTDLNVANDIVEDIISLFEEIEQKAETKEKTAADVVEQAYAKEDVLLEIMEEAKDKLDDMEMWLGEKGDDIKVTTEAFDQEEMPESGVATGALSTEVEDMISDLLEEDEDMADAADDGSTNHAMPDLPMGWEVIEGDLSSFSAKGKSGNDTPDHKEQDGRSNVGRQGMSVGETAAGSGTIQEGDKNIEERRTEDPTQSGQVDLDGEADTNATGGGKLATGKADSQGMGGGAERFDSNEEGSWEGMAALMARQADAMYAKASLKNVRVDSLKNAAHHLRQAADAIASGNIQQLDEHRRLAVTSLQRAKAQLDAGPSGAIDMGSKTGLLDDVIESGPDQAPPRYRDRVAEYFKALNDAL